MFRKFKWKCRDIAIEKTADIVQNTPSDFSTECAALYYLLSAPKRVCKNPDKMPLDEFKRFVRDVDSYIVQHLKGGAE